MSSFCLIFLKACSCALSNLSIVLWDNGYDFRIYFNETFDFDNFIDVSYLSEYNHRSEI